jgi:hypothetical protein
MIVGMCGYSQSLVLIYNGKELSNGQIIRLDSIDANFGYIKAVIGVKNQGDREIEVNVKKIAISVINNSSNLFCWGVNCYSPSVTESRNAVLIPAKTTNESFYAEYEPANAASGVSVVEYQFYEVTDASNSATITVHFVEGSGTGLIKLESGEYLNLFAEQKSGNIQVSYNLLSESHFIIHNLAGQIVGECALPSATATINLPFQLRKGTYIYSIIRSNKFVKPNKFIVF